MRPRFLLCLLSLLVLITVAAQAEWNTPITAQSHSDTLVSTERDTVTFEATNGNILFVQLVTSDAGTISGGYRCFVSDSEYHLANASQEPLIFIKTDGSKTSSLTAAADGCYTIELNPFGGDFHQFILSGSTTIKYKLICKRRSFR